MSFLKLLFEQNKTEFGLLASTIDKSLLKESLIPDQLRDEIPTLNQFGYMKLDFSDYCKEFIEYATTSKEMVLEIGCAYGFVVRQVLRKGGKIVASDISIDHLAQLLRRSMNDNLDNLYLFPGKFPDQIDFPKHSLGAVLTSRIIHFLEGEDVTIGLTKICNWLKPAGKLFFVATSPYNESMRDNVLPIYKQREKEGCQWPGLVDTSNVDEHHRQYIPSFINVFDIPQLERLLPEHGFRIDRISLFDYPNDTDSGGKGHVGFVATKI